MAGLMQTSPLSPAEEQSLRELKLKLIEFLDQDLESIQLFGSKVCGDAEPRSDTLMYSVWYRA